MPGRQPVGRVAAAGDDAALQRAGALRPAAEPYLEQMERWVSASQPKDFLRDHMHLDTNLPIASLVAAPLFLVPSQVIAHLDGDAFYMLLGVGGALLEAQEPTFGSWGCRRCGFWAVLSECRCWKP